MKTACPHHRVERGSRCSIQAGTFRARLRWTGSKDLNDPLRRDYLDKSGFEALASRIGITPDTTVVFYGDKSNWWATYALWVFELFGHTNANDVIMDGGRLKWADEGRELTRDKPVHPTRASYSAPERDDSQIRVLPRRRPGNIFRLMDN